MLACFGAHGVTEMIENTGEIVVSDPSKSALAQLAAEMGPSEAHTRGAAEISDGQDLFGALDAEVEGFAGHAIAPPRRGPGRPAGSPNRSTLQLQGYLRARGYRDPAEFLAATASMDVRALAAALAGHGDPGRVTFDQAIEALKLQRAAAAELLPYFHQRMPQAVHHTGDNGRPVIMIVDAATAARGARGDGAMSAYEIEEIQGLTDGDAKPSHGDASHGNGEAGENQHVTSSKAGD